MTSKLSREVRKRIATEKRIATKVVHDLLAAGYRLNVNNGGDTNELDRPSDSAKAVLGALFATDDEYLKVYASRPNLVGQKSPLFPWMGIGWVYFVYGNDGGENVIADHTCNLENALAGASALAESLAPQ